VSVKNYHAFIRAARKHGGLSLPAARKVAKKVAARLDRPVKGVDVQKHPRIFRDALTAAQRRKKAGLSAPSKRRSGMLRKQTGASTRASSAGVKRSAVGRIPAGKKQAARGGAAPGKAQQAGPSRLVVAREEYISSPEYTKSNRSKGVFHLQLQIHINGPAGLNKKQLDRIAADWLKDGSKPNGFEVRALEWNGKETKDPRVMRVARSNFRAIPFTF